ncbi:hypothetical protein [Mycobacterium sp.]|uniref:hypothetical protein n=1 Tax=Mycobacterium sp. TaxID=1785 RepID=UPI003C731790
MDGPLTHKPRRAVGHRRGVAPGGPGRALVVDTFYRVESQPVPAQRVHQVTGAVAAADASALYAVAYSYAPFHCPDCPASYCGEHWAWRRFDGDFSGIEGRCPDGHFHVLCY